MTTFLFSSFRILKIPPYINFEKFFDRNLAPPSVQRPGTAATPCPPRYATGNHCWCPVADWDLNLIR